MHKQTWMWMVLLSLSAGTASAQMATGRRQYEPIKAKAAEGKKPGTKSEPKSKARGKGQAQGSDDPNEKPLPTR